MCGCSKAKTVAAKKAAAIAEALRPKPKHYQGMTTAQVKKQLSK